MPRPGRQIAHVQLRQGSKRGRAVGPAVRGVEFHGLLRNVLDLSRRHGCTTCRQLSRKRFINLSLRLRVRTQYHTLPVRVVQQALLDQPVEHARIGIVAPPAIRHVLVHAQEHQRIAAIRPGPAAGHEHVQRELRLHLQVMISQLLERRLHALPFDSACSETPQRIEDQRLERIRALRLCALDPDKKCLFIGNSRYPAHEHIRTQPGIYDRLLQRGGLVPEQDVIQHFPRRDRRRIHRIAHKPAQ